MQTTQKNNILTALKKARSSLDRTIAALESGEAQRAQCFDVLQQNLAAIGLIKAANKHVLARHIADVLAQCDASPRRAARLRDELVKVIEAAQRK